MMHKGILQIADIRLVARPYLQVATTAIIALGLLGGWAGSEWLTVLVIFAVLFATVIWIGRRARLQGPKPIYVYISTAINLTATAVIVIITGGAQSPFWLLFLVGSITSAMSFRGREGANLERLNISAAALAFIVPNLMDWPPRMPLLALSGMELLTLLMSSVMIRNITFSILESSEIAVENERRFRGLFEQTHDAVFILDLQGRHLAANQRAADMLGYTREQLLGLSFRETSAEMEQSGQILERLVHGEVIPPYERRFRRKNGEIFLGETIVELVCDSHGNPQHVQSVVRDITKRRQIEDELQASEQRYRELFAKADQQAHELRLLHEVRTALADKLNLPDIFHAVVEAIADVFGYTLVSFYLLEGEVLTLQHQVGYEQTIPQIPVTQGVIGSVVRTGKGRLLEDVHTEPAFLGAIEGIISEIAIPIFIKAQIFGVLNVESIHGVKFAESDLRLLSAVSEHLSVAVDRAQLYALLQESEAHYRSLFADSPISLWEEDFSLVKNEIEHLHNAGVTDFQDYFESHPDEVTKCKALVRVTNVNQSTLKLFNAHSSAELTENFVRVILAASHSTFTEELVAIAAGQTSFNFEDVYHTLNGEPIQIMLYWSVLSGYEDTLSKVIVSVLDVTKRKQMEEALRASEEQFRILFENAPIGIGVADLQGNLLTFNDAILQPGGFSRDDIKKIGNVAALYFDPKKRDEALGVFQKQGFLRNFEVQFKRKDGTPYDTLLSLTRIAFDGRPCIQAMVEDISERKQAEQALRDSENRFRSLIEHAADQVSLLAPDGRLFYENPTAVRPLGYPMGAFLGRNIFELLHPDDVDRARQTWGEVLSQPGNSQQASFRLRHADGSWRWIEGTATNLLDDPTVQAIVINYRDVTERKGIEQALSESEERYRLITQNAQDIIWTTNMELQLTYVSPSLEQALGYSAQELMTLTPDQLLTPDSLTSGLQIFAEELRAFQPQPDPNYARVLELEYRRKDGSTFWVEMKFNFFRDAARRPTGILGVGRDVTLRKQAEERIAQMNTELEQRVTERTADLERANQLLTSLGQAAIATTQSLDLDRVLDKILQYARAIVPYQGANVMFVEGEFAYVGRYLGYEGHPEVKEHLLNIRFPLSWPSLQHMLTTGESMYVPNTAQFPGWQSSGTLEWAHAYIGVPLKAGLETIGFLNASSNRPDGFQPDDVKKLEALSAHVVNALQNARLLKQLETALQQEQTMRAQLVHADKLAALGKMVAVIAHEINNPIQTIKNSFFLLSGRVESDGKVGTVLKIAETEANRIADLIAQLRDAYRPRSATFTLVNLLTLLGEVEMILTPQMKKSRVNWSQPVEFRPCRVFAIRNSLKQVFINLALNAIEAMEADQGGEITIRLEVSPEGKLIGVAVHNTGPMIPEDVLPKIFDPFFTTKGTGGTGLGLSITYDIVQQHLGKITVENDPGMGVVFTVWLPLAPEAE